MAVLGAPLCRDLIRQWLARVPMPTSEAADLERMLGEGWTLAPAFELEIVQWHHGRGHDPDRVVYWDLPTGDLTYSGWKPG